MSNLLIGIIGVALFIGIAIAGAVFLGPRFEDSATNSVASNSIQAVTLVATAANSYRMATGYVSGSDMGTPQSLVDAGFMKSVPTNPSASGAGLELVDASGTDYDLATDKAGFSPRYVALSIGSDRALCTAVERQASNIGSESSFDDGQKDLSGFSPRNSGCFHSSSKRMSSMTAGDYLVYARM